MKRFMFILTGACLIVSTGTTVLSKDVPVPKPRFYKSAVKEDLPEIYNDPRANVIAAVDTYCIVWFDFEQMNWQGWTSINNTAQAGTFVTVEDFAGLGGGSHGRLVPLEGTRSAWFGLRPGGDPYTCSWPGSTPGYGNDWDQWLIAWAPDTLVEISYHLVCDTEPGKDIVEVGWFNGHEEVVATYSGVVDTVATHTFEKSYSTSWGAYYFFRFTSDGAVSDQDGLIDTDGAVIVDSITIVYDGSVLEYEDFESFTPGTVPDGRWDGRPGEAYYSYIGLANNLVDRDPCNDDFGTQIIFYSGSAYPSPDYPWPGLFTTPFCTGGGAISEPCQDEMAASHWIDLRYFSSACDDHQDTAIPPGELPDLGGVKLIYQVYLDNPIENLVFHTWKVRSMVDGCPQAWKEEPLIMYYGDDELYYWFEHDISGMIESDTIQVAVGVVDMCSVWYGIYGDCAEHTPAPWFDNIRIQRYATVGPQWAYQGADLFQDNFPSTDDMESFVRVDMAADISPLSYPGIVPGDSVVVTCWAPNTGGLDTLGTGEPRVYLHCNAIFLGLDGKPDLFGPSLEGTYGTYVSDDGDWTVILCEPAWTSFGVIAPDRYCVDLNDSLFTRGYMIEYYFKAYDLDGVSTTLPAGAEDVPPDPCLETCPRFEFTCLPLLQSVPNILYVDDFEGRGTQEGLVQTYLDPTVDATSSAGSPPPERYDINQPSSNVGNGLGSRARPALLHAAYEGIFWDSGDLDSGTIVSDYHPSDKSDDVGALVSWLDDFTYGPFYPDCDATGGLVIMGDNVASDLNGSSDGRVLLNDWCAATLIHDSYFEMTGGMSGGGVVNPSIICAPGLPYGGLEFYLAGGCPGISDFDVIEAAGSGWNAVVYPDYYELPYYAGVLNRLPNSQGVCVATGIFGFSFMKIRNDGYGALARNEFYIRTMRSWLTVGGGSAADITESDIPAVTALTGSFPNPFNPVTRISFSLKEKGTVSLRIYDVSGRLVRILVDEIRDAGSYEMVWDGTNNRGRSTASGIYFCRMEAEDYQRTVKMVLLR